MVVKPASDFSAEHGVSFVSVTQQFNTTTSMGRLTLNVLLSFAQFEREITSERIPDKIASSKRKGLWVGGMFVSGARAGRGGRWCAGAATLGLCFVAGLFLRYCRTYRASENSASELFCRGLHAAAVLRGLQ